MEVLLTVKNASITCPKCGSPDLSEIAWNRRRCNHCGTESVLSDDRTRLELIGWQCPKCGFNNESETTYCGKCGAALVKPCPKCFSEMREDLEFCSKCGSNYASERRALFRRAEEALEKGLKPEREVEYLNLALKLAPDDCEALVLRGEIYLLERQWRKGISDWGVAYRVDPDDPAVCRVLDDFIGRHLGLLKTPGLVDACLTDEGALRYLAVMRDKSSVAAPSPPSIPPFKHPRAPGKISMALLHPLWPAKARRMEEMYEIRLQAQQEKHAQMKAAKEENHRSRLSEYEAASAERERARNEVFGDRLTLAAMCAEALEEKDQRERIAAQKAAKELKKPEAKGGVMASPSNRKSMEERKEILSRQVQQSVARGARIESQSDTMAVVVTGKKVNHVLHFLIGVVTLGIWWIVWLILIIAGGEKRKMITVDEYGLILLQKA